MNILIPHQWLLEHLHTKATPKQIQKYLSLCGPSVEHTYKKEGENVYDIEVTTNRVDSMSIRGIAREATAILPRFGLKASLKKLNLPKIKMEQGAGAKSLPLPKISNNPKLSKRLACVVLSGVKRTPTPSWMAKRLLQTEMNVHDSVIDITNYVTHELGHPCHAFDYDKVMNTGGEIIVVEAKRGEKFTTLDGETFTTLGGEVVFKNGEGTIIDLPSIKGTANTSIDENTTNVLLLLESIVAKKVRFASMSHAIRTTAAQLMEKNVDPDLIIPTLEFGVRLYRDLCGAKVASPVFDDFPGKIKPKTVPVSLTKIQDYLGKLDLDYAQLTKKVFIPALESLEMAVVYDKESDSLLVTPPTFRPDITIPADVIEEIARIYGYHNLPSPIMETAIPLDKPKDTNFDVENRIKRFLAAIGWQEIYSYSMVSEEIALQTKYALGDHLKLQNPLTEDRVYLRRSLIPSLTEVIKANPLEKTLSVFEIANLYHKKSPKELPNEELHLTLVSTEDYRKVRGDFETLLDQFFVEKIKIDKSGNITANKTKLGQVTVDQKLVAIDIKFSELLKIIKTHPTYEPISKTGFIREDLTFTIENEVALGELIALLENQSQLITGVTLKGQYQDNYTFEVEYHDDEKNLSGIDIEPLRRKIINQAENFCEARLVGSVK